MDTLDRRVMDLIRGRASWNTGVIHLRLAEICDTLLARHGGQRPNPKDIRTTVRRLAKQGRVRWATVNDQDVHILAG